MQNEARIYSKSLEGDKQLTSSFKVKEFACNDGSDVILIHTDLPAVLQNIRNQFGLYKSFVHVDVRSMRYRWDQRSGKEVAVSGF